jgi:hypothetical protein
VAGVAALAVVAAEAVVVAGSFCKAGAEETYTDELLGIQQDGHRTIVDEFNFHVSLKDTGFDAHS